MTIKITNFCLHPSSPHVLHPPSIFDVYVKACPSLKYRSRYGPASSQAQGLFAAVLKGHSSKVRPLEKNKVNHLETISQVILPEEHFLKLDDCVPNYTLFDWNLTHAEWKSTGIK